MTADGVGGAARLDRAGYQPAFVEDFADANLDPARWVAHYLPQWTTPARSLARYDLRPGWLRLRVDADQPAWREADGALRASNIQTGTFSGPVGSEIGQHRYRGDLHVVTEQEARRLYLPVATPAETILVEADLRASPDPTVMLALWLIGFEDRPERSGELCVAELFGNAIGTARSRVNMGVKAHHDPRLREDMRTVELDVNAATWHTYSVEWTTTQARFFVDDALIRTVHQGVDYPLQVMIDLFEFPDTAARDRSAYPKFGDVRSIRGYVRKRAAA